jgi:hypothetical protein
MGGRRDRERTEGGVEPAYEGPERLSELLGHAGSAFTAEDVVSRFRHALAHGAGRDVAIPALFEGEPRFASPDDARRLYANLFGLWDRVRAGRGAAEGDDAAPPPAPVPTPAPLPAGPALPPRGSEPGRVVSQELVEAAWRHLDLLPPRERRRRRDRFEAAQPDLAAWVEALALPDVGSVAAQDLAFELWTMFDQAFGDRLGAVAYSELRALEAEPPPIEADQPALAAYVAEVLDLVAEEEPGFEAEARAQVERAVAAVVAALAAAVARER